MTDLRRYLPGRRSDTPEAFLTRLGHLLLRRSWDDIGRRNGLALLTDHIHLNDRAADILADLVNGFLDPSSPRADS